MKTQLLIIGMTMLMSCNLIDSSIVHLDGDYKVTIEVKKDFPHTVTHKSGSDGWYQTITRTANNDGLVTTTYYKNKEIGFPSQRFKLLEEKIYNTVIDTVWQHSFVIWHSDINSLNQTLPDSIQDIQKTKVYSHTEYLDSLDICSELEAALLTIENHKERSKEHELKRIAKECKINRASELIKNIKEICN